MIVKRRYASLYIFRTKKSIYQIANFSGNFFRARIHRIQSQCNNVVEDLTGILNVIDKLTEKLGLLSTVGAGLGIAALVKDF